MLGFERPTMKSRMLRHKVLTASLALVLVGGVGFAATGGANAVRQLMVQVKMIGSDGQIYDGTLEAVGSDGSTFQLQTPDGGNATVILNQTDPNQLQVQITKEGDGAAAAIVTKPSGEIWQVDPPEGPVQITMTAELGDEHDAAINAVLQQHMAEITASGSSGGKILINGATTLRQGPAVVDQIAEPEDVFQWEDDDGATQEVSIVRTEGDLGGYRIYSTLDDGRYAQIGVVMLSNAADTVVEDLTFDKDGRTTLLFSDSDGREISVPVKPVSRIDQVDAAGGSPRQIILHKRDQARE